MSVELWAKIEVRRGRHAHRTRSRAWGLNDLGAGLREIRQHAYAAPLSPRVGTCGTLTFAVRRIKSYSLSHLNERPADPTRKT